MQKIKLLGKPIINEDERATESILPGSLVAFSEDGFGVQLSDNGEQTIHTFALERDELGCGLDAPYAFGDIVKVGFFVPGMRVYARLSGTALVKGDMVASAGDGTLEKAVTTYIGRMLEDLNPDGDVVYGRVEIVCPGGFSAGGGGGAAVGDLVLQDITVTEDDDWDGSGDLPLSVVVPANRKLLAVQVVGRHVDLEATLWISKTADASDKIAVYNLVDPIFLSSGDARIFGESSPIINWILPSFLLDEDSDIGGNIYLGYANDGANPPGQGPWVVRLWLQVTA